MAYKLILYIHVLSAIVSIGPFFVLLAVGRSLAETGEEEEKVQIDLFRKGIFIVKHAGHVLVISGVLLILYGSWSWTESWIVMTLIVMLGSIFFLARAFTPGLTKLEEGIGSRASVIKELRQSLYVYISLLLIMLWFMVVKPRLW